MEDYIHAVGKSINSEKELKYQNRSSLAKFWSLGHLGSQNLKYVGSMLSLVHAVHWVTWVMGQVS